MEPDGGTPSQSNAPDAQPAEETIESMRTQLDAARAENDDQLRGWQRTQADFANFRRRSEQEKEELTKYAEAGLILDLLPVVDDLDRALDGLPADLRALSWVQGILLIERKLRTVLEAHGVRPIEALGKEFDPHRVGSEHGAGGGDHGYRGVSNWLHHARPGAAPDSCQGRTARKFTQSVRADAKNYRD